MCSRRTPYEDLTPQQVTLGVATKDLRPDPRLMISKTPPKVTFKHKNKQS